MTTIVARAALGAALILLVSGTVRAAETSPGPSANDWRPDYDAAVVLIKAEKYDAGIAKLKAIGVDDADINNQLGFAYRKLGKWDEAVRYYEAALKIDPNHKGALEYYGEYFVNKGDLAKAKAHLLRLEKVCGKGCEEYKDLAAAIEKKEKK